MNTRLLLSLLGAVTLCAHAQITPLNEPLVEEQEMTITCELTKIEPYKNIVVFRSVKDSEKIRGTYHYKLWLPKGYLADTTRHWPCMFISSPVGNAEMGSMKPRLEKSYVVVMLVESKNGDWGVCMGNFAAAHDDVMQRVRIQEGLKFATGLSGGARVASCFVQMRPGFAGLIMQAAGMADYNTPMRRDPGLMIALSLGKDDPNVTEIPRMRKALWSGARYTLEKFDGGHDWAPPVVFDKMLTEMEQDIFVTGPIRPALKGAYAARFKDQYAGYTAATEPWERFKQGNALLEFARARNLTMEPTVSPTLRTLQTEVAKLRTSPAIGKEAMAADSWKRLQDSNRGATPEKKAADAKDFAKRYPGTEAAKKAEELAQ